MTNNTITKSQAKKLAKMAGSKTGKLKKKHIKKLKDEVRRGVLDLETDRSFNLGELAKLGLYE